ncbi:diol dehydratase small subunit [Kineosporia sp. J2-2]|uniref:Diol dehydratase small subunit n=1 Tax=Kineosporia corallincola TaxID=2835133 RepID=A0ABS5TTD0_9ACTN|nr:diol dehydratase small subunit [Kineosporia corallincola]MBT0774072.1 diol dehydratase small subunit [Kineosporia corallincola]
MPEPAFDPATDYPVSTKRPDLLRTPTGKPISELTMQNVVSGRVQPEDLRIAPGTLRIQAEVADASGRPQLGQNFRRAAELIAVSDARVLEMYNALRPHASTREQLLAIADELESGYGGQATAALVREAAEVYERRGLLAAPEA